MSENNEIKEPLNKNYKVPKLRFPEFKNDYNNFRFSTLFKIFNGLNKDKESFGFGNPIVNYMDVNKNLFLNKKIILGKVNTTKDEINRFKITTDDILLTRTSETKKEIAYASCLLDEVPNCVYSGFLLKASPIKKELTCAPYITLLLHSPIYRNKLMKISTETSRALINSDNLSRLNLLIPSITEQNKIFSLFSLLEIKISNIESKIIVLKKYKEGFTKRLTKTLNNDVIALSNICSITTGKMDANAMNPEGKYKFFTCSREDYFIDTYAFDCEALLVSGNGEVGLTKYYNGKFNAYQRTYVLYNLKKNAKFIKLFIDLQINTIIRKETNKGAMPYIRLTTFNKIIIPNIDPSLEYLISIAIDKIDKKIELLQNHARVLNNIKNNLLGSLFI